MSNLSFTSMLLDPDSPNMPTPITSSRHYSQPTGNTIPLKQPWSKSTTTSLPISTKVTSEPSCS